MPRIRHEENWNKVNTKQELLQLMKRYRGILTNPMIEYLNSLIQLEFSVVRDYIGEKERKSLAELEIYKRIAIYNIYNRALNLLKQNKINHNIMGNKQGFESLTISVPLNDEKNIDVFQFDYKGFQFNELPTVKIPDEYRTMTIGTISLYQTLENQELRNAELIRVMKKLEELYNHNHPFVSNSVPKNSTGLSPIGRRKPRLYDSRGLWIYKHAQEIKAYEERFAQLDGKKELSDIEKKQINITNQIRNLLLEDYGLTDESFEEIERFNSPEKSVLQKTLVKKQPNLTISNQITYV